MLSDPFFDASGNKNIGATIRIAREIQCLPYAGFLEKIYDINVTSVGPFCFINFTS